MRPGTRQPRTLGELRGPDDPLHKTVAEEARAHTLEGISLVRRLNNGSWPQSTIGLAALFYILLISVFPF